MKFTLFYILAFLKTITFQKIINLLKLKCEFAKFVFFKKAELTAYPYSLSIEPTNVCNLRCPECLTGNLTLTRRKDRKRCV